MITLEQRVDYFVGHFKAMASNCEVLIDNLNESFAHEITQRVATEVTRIEQKYSRYRDDNILHKINSGSAVDVDEETAQLLNYAQQLYQLSDGLFDITSGVLRRAWHFDGSDNIPSAEDVNALMPLIGWDKVSWNNLQIHLPPKMEIDFGGIGKEYAADRAAQSVITLLHEHESANNHTTSVLINLGGDIALTGPRKDDQGWHIGVIAEQQNTPQKQADFSVKYGGVATSGDANRYLEKNGQRYSTCSTHAPVGQ